MYLLRWIGSNQDPYIFQYAYATTMFPPKGANRGRYTNPHVDQLLVAASAEPDQAKRRAVYLVVQQILADDLPSIPLWYPDNVILHSPRVTDIQPRPRGQLRFSSQSQAAVAIID